MSDKKERIRDLVAQARRFQSCGASDDPEEQAACTANYNYLVVQFQRLAGPMLPPDLSSRLNSIQVDFDSIYSVYTAQAELDALLPDIEDALATPSDSSGQTFSKRYGYRSPAKEIVVREDAPENLRHFVLDTAIRLGLLPSDLRTLICSVLHRRPDPGNWSEYPNVWDEVQDLVYGCDWFKVYDFIERVYRRFGTGTGEAAAETPKEFQTALNQFFVDEGIGWQMVDGQVMTPKYCWF